MNKTLNVLASTSILVLLVLSSCGGFDSGEAKQLLDVIEERGYILVSTDADYEPQSWLYSEGQRPSDTKCPTETLTTAEMRGFDVDVAESIGDFLGVETCFTTPSWETVAAGNWEDKWDISVGSMTITAERQQLFDFSVPYYFSPAVVAVRADVNLNSLDDLAGQALCVGESTTYEAWLKREDLGPSVTIISQAPEQVTVILLDTDQRCPKSLADGRSDYVGYVTSQMVVDANIAEGIPVIKLNGPVFFERLATAYDKASAFSNVTLRAEVDKLFTDMHSNGALSELSKKWFTDENGEGFDYTSEPR